MRWRFKVRLTSHPAMQPRGSAAACLAVLWVAAGLRKPGTRVAVLLKLFGSSSEFQKVEIADGHH